ncbi:MAG: hypothetical protein WC375_12175 [Methanomassiliicoccales archaeon]|jgi:hypothetical protein
MCTQSNTDIVKAVVNEFISKRWAFTAYTITLEARKRGADEYHNELKKVVHSMFANGEMNGFVRELANIPNAPRQPFLYQPDPNAAPSSVPATDSDANTQVDGDGIVQSDSTLVS